MRLKNIYIPVIFIVILFGGIALSDVLGLWETESDKEPALIKEGEFEGMYDPADIRGSYAFSDIANSFDITPEILAEAFGVDPERAATFLCKDLEEIYAEISDTLEIGTGSVRQFVALYTGIPYEGDDGLPISAKLILEREGKWTEELELLFADRLVDLTTLDLGDMEEASNSAVETDEAEAETEVNKEADTEEHVETIGVKGKTTVADVLDWGLTLEEVEAVLGVKVENKNLKIQDICTQNDIYFGDVKTQLNALLGID